jgi:hypothetical protein
MKNQGSNNVGVGSTTVVSDVSDWTVAIHPSATSRVQRRFALKRRGLPTMAAHLGQQSISLGLRVVCYWNKKKKHRSTVGTLYTAHKLLSSSRLSFLFSHHQEKLPNIEIRRRDFFFRNRGSLGLCIG